MPVKKVVAESTTTKHSVRVEWFRREPGGSTIFVKPTASDDVAPHQVTDAAVEAGVSR